MNQEQVEMGGAPPDVHVPQGNPAGAAAVNGVSADSHELVDNLEQLNSQGFILDNIISLIFNLVDGYDNSGLSTTMASTIIKLKYGSDAKNSDYLTGATILVAAMMAQRLLGSAATMADNAMREYDRFVEESERKEKLREQMKTKKALLENLIALLENANNDFSQSMDATDVTYRPKKLKQLRAHRREAQILLGYEFCLMSELPGNNAQNAEDGKIYLDTNGNYCVRDPNGIVQQGLIPNDIKISQLAGINDLAVQIKDEAFQAAILRVTTHNDHTFNLRAGIRRAQAAQIQAVINDPQAHDDDEQARLIPADEGVELVPMNEYVIPEDESAWFVINEVMFRVALGSYLSQATRLTPYDKHVLYSTLREATQGDEVVAAKYRKFITAKDEGARKKAAVQLTTAVEAALKKRITVTPVSFPARVVKAIGNFIFANSAGISVVTGIAGLIAFAVPGAALIMLGVYISAIVVGVTFATVKVAYDMYKERKHEKIKDVIDKESGRHGQALMIKNLLGNARKLSQLPPVVNPVINPAAAPALPEMVAVDADGEDVDDDDYDKVAYVDALTPVNEGKQESYASRAISVVYITFIGVLTGASFVNAISALVIGISAEIGTGLLGLTGAAATALPIVGAVVAAGFFIFKTVLSLYQEYKAEQKRIDELKANIDAQMKNAEISENNVHREINQLQPTVLLKKYIADYLTSPEGLSNAYNPADTQGQITAKAKARSDFFRRIEQLVGESKDEALSPNDYYNYLAHNFTKGLALDDPERATRLQLISELRAYMPEQDVVAQSVIIKNVPGQIEPVKLDYPVTFTPVANAAINPSAKLKKKPALLRYKPAGEGYEFVTMPATAVVNGEVNPRRLNGEQIYLELSADHRLKYTVINPSFTTLGKLAVKAETGYISVADLQALGFTPAQLQGLQDHPAGNLDMARITPLLPGVLKVATANKHISPKLDHAGNFHRVREKYSSTTNFIFGAMTPIIIGFALALTFGSGPAFPYVALALAVVLVALFVTSKILEYIRNLRLKEYDKIQAQVDIRDKTVEYDPRIRPAVVAAVNPHLAGAPAPGEAPVVAPGVNPHPQDQPANVADAQAVNPPLAGVGQQPLVQNLPAAAPQPVNPLPAGQQPVEQQLPEQQPVNPPVAPQREASPRMSRMLNDMGFFNHSDDESDDEVQHQVANNVGINDALDHQHDSDHSDDETAHLIAKDNGNSGIASPADF